MRIASNHGSESVCGDTDMGLNVCVGHGRRTVTVMPTESPCSADSAMKIAFGTQYRVSN
jgi:hypothetical protein